MTPAFLAASGTDASPVVTQPRIELAQASPCLVPSTFSVTLSLAFVSL